MSYIRRLIVFCAIGFIASALHAQDSDHIKWLQNDVGKWDVELKFWPNGEGGDPIVFKAIETNQLLGEHWIVSDLAAEFSGQTFRGHGIYGFDQTKDCFVATWVDSANGFMSRHEGKLDSEKNELVLLGKEIDPSTGELVEGKRVHTIDADHTRRVESFQKKEGSDDFVKVMTVTLKRID